MRGSDVRQLCLWLFVATALLVTGCQPKNQFVPPPPPEVTVAHPLEREVADSIEFVGTTQATATVELRARVNGYLEKIQFEDGANVDAGAPLFLIEQAPYQIALEAGRAAMQKAQSELALAQSQYRRMEPLLAQRAITPEELDVQRAQVSTANADVAAAKSAVDRAELDLKYTEIRAPIAGHIGRHLVDVGNLVLAEQTTLARIESIDPIYAVFDVSERDLLRFMKMLRDNELPDPDKNPPTLYLGLENEQGFPHAGRLDYRELGIDPRMGTAMRRAIFPNPERQLLPGMHVRIRAQIGRPKPRLMVEEGAIGTDQRGDFLLVVNDKNKVEYRLVQLGISADGMRVVEQGVGPEDWVIVSGLQRARPGAEVKPIQVEMKPVEGAVPPAVAAPAGQRAPSDGAAAAGGAAPQAGTMEPRAEK
jgi:RND family efflux transporter MFP subunit